MIRLEKKPVVLWLLFLLSSLLVPAYAQHPWEKEMEALGLVNVQDLDPSIEVDLKYASTDNFVGQDMYNGFRKAYLAQSFARQLVEAHKRLKKEHPYYRFIIYDAARPLSVQKKMYAIVQGTPNDVYVAYPKGGGRHNFGAAVDLSIVDIRTGKALDMGTPFDYFGPEAHVGNEEGLLKEGKISAEAVKNRKLLYTVMAEVGLVPYRREWWHYQEDHPISTVRERHTLLQF